ncbi:Protein of unknown function [Pyronema omphalodes CBS 100304]|uniref:Uncharacterized protein n=1 Tax=Pyronema omphalodes (strain CBS 100304) TaxID=1076935 RepID=U4LN31_PYROM|nr:Protein of unknown function [Pyronema omphalodes CBS 100304]
MQRLKLVLQPETTPTSTDELIAEGRGFSASAMPAEANQQAMKQDMPPLYPETTRPSDILAPDQNLQKIIEQNLAVGLERERTKHLANSDHFYDVNKGGWQASSTRTHGKCALATSGRTKLSLRDLFTNLAVDNSQGQHDDT